MSPGFDVRIMVLIFGIGLILEKRRFIGANRIMVDYAKLNQ